MMWDVLAPGWTAVSKAVPRAEAEQIWGQRTRHATQNINYDDPVYYRVVPAGSHDKAD
jgi:hypothetical protein